MSTDLLQPNPELEKAIAAAQSPQQVAEILRIHQEKSGTPQWDNRPTYWPNTLPDEAKVPTVPAVTHPESDDRLLRRAVIMPDGTTRLLEAYSTSGLDVLQRALETGHI